MSEPIELYDAAGNVVISHSPMVAEGLIEAGELFIVAPPVIEETEKPPTKQKASPKGK